VLSAFREVVVADFEFAAPPGERPRPLCLVAHELHSRRRFRVWEDQFGSVPPYAVGPDVLFIGYSQARSWAVTGYSAGQCRRVSLISSPNFATALTAFLSPVGPVSLGR